MDLLFVAGLGVEFCAEAVQLLGGFGGVVRHTGDAFAGSFFMVETFAVEFGPAFDVFVLRHCDGLSSAMLVATSSEGFTRGW